MTSHGESARNTPSSAARTAATRSPTSVLLPLALAQFIASYAASNMNVAISSIATDLGTSVRGVQTAITFFTLTMAALMIPGSKLTDIWGRRTCFVIGLVVYGVGALIAALAQGLGILIIGYSLLEGVGSALMIPPIYILVTVTFSSVESRAKSFGIVSGAAGLGSATGPLIGGLITSAISWRASFVVQALVVATIVVLSRSIADAGVQGARPRFDILGAVLSAAGLFFVVSGILLSGTFGWLTAREAFTIGSTELIPQGGISPVWLFAAIGAVILAAFFLHCRNWERADKKPLLSTRLFRNRVSDLGLVTQLMQWLTLQGSFFVVSVYLQQVRGYNAVQTGLTLTPATAGILLASALAERMASRRPQRTLIWAGFATTIAGTLLLLLLVDATSGFVSYIPGLLLMGIGIGAMLTASVNVVQSAFPEQDQGEISGLSRSVSNLGSSLGTAIVGSVLVAELLGGNKSFGLALITMAVFGVIGLVAALLLPATRTAPRARAVAAPNPA